MWTRAPPFTSDYAVVPSCLALDQEAEAGEEACCPRLHRNHQPGEQEPLEYHHYHAVTKYTLALDYSHSSSHPTSHIHHDPPEATGSSKRLPTQGFPSKRSCTKHQHSPMSSPESASVLARDRELLLPEVDTKLGSCSFRARERRQLDDMQPQTTRNASSDQEVPELVALLSPPKRRRVLLLNEFVKPKDSPHLSSAPGDHSGVTAEQLMADLDSGSKASTPDCQVPASVEEGADQLAAPQCSSTPPGKQVVEEEANHNVESNVTLEQSSRQLDPHPSDDDTQSTSQIRIWVPHSQPSRYCSKTMATRGSDEWLQLSLGSGVQPEETPPEDRPGESPTQTRNPSTSTDLPPGGDIRDFFRFGSESEAHQSSSPVTPRHQQQYSGTPEFSVPRPLTFLEPGMRSSRDSLWMDPNVAIPRGEGQFLSPSPVVQQRPAFSNLATLPYRPARALQLVRSEQTDTTSVYASPWMGTQQHPYQEAPRTPPEFLSMATPGVFRDWRSAGASAASSGSLLSMQPPLAQGVDPEQAWRNLLQRVGSNLSVPGGFGAAGASSSSGRGEPMMLPPSEREEYLDALTRAVERFQGADQGGNDEPLTELQRLQRNAMFPPVQRPHRGPSFGPSTEISMARYFNTSSSSGSKPRAPAPAPSSDRQRRILRPHAPRPGLWFTLQASTSQPEASPLQQIPTAYIRVVDDNMTVAAVRRYLVSKLGLASEDEVELTCRGQPLQPSLPLSQVRDGIWQSPSTNTPTPSTSQLLSEGKAWKAPDGSITLVEDVVMVLTYGRGLQAPPPTST